MRYCTEYRFLVLPTKRREKRKKKRMTRCERLMHRIRITKHTSTKAFSTQTYIFNVLSLLPLAALSPEGLQSTVKTSSKCPGNSIFIFFVLMSQSLIVLSLLHERIILLSLDHTTWYTSATCPRREAMNLKKDKKKTNHESVMFVQRLRASVHKVFDKRKKTYFPSRLSQILTDLSKLAEAM
jgi:hypothetical protein